MEKNQIEVARETDRIFREVALAWGGIVATHDVCDDLVWTVTKTLQRLYERSKARHRPSDPAKNRRKGAAQLHPSVIDLLARIGR